MDYKKYDPMFETAGAPVALPPLPYPTDALAPIISEKTLTIHYGQHHKQYVDQLRELIKGTAFENSSLEQIMKATRGGKLERESIYMLSSLAWNHAFYWNSMTRREYGEPGGRLGRMITESFKTFDDFRNAFLSAAMQVGVGWVWLLHEGDKLKILRTEYHESPMFGGAGRPLLALDVWEHAYYLDFQSRRDIYVNGYLERLANWDFAETRLNPE